MSDNTADTVSFDASPLRMALFTLVGAGMTAAAFYAGMYAPAGSYPQFMGWIGVPFFAACAIVALWQTLTMRGPVVILSPDGIRDIRIAENELPWPSVQAVATWEYRRQKFLVLALSDEAWQAVAPKPIARMTRGANAKLGADSYCINPQGLKTNFETLRAAVMVHVRTRDSSGEGV